MCSSEWPGLSLLQAVHSQRSLWTVIPLRWDYLLPPSTFPLQEPNTSHFLTDTWYSLLLTGDSCSPVHATLPPLCGWSFCQISQDLTVLSPEWFLNYLSHSAIGILYGLPSQCQRTFNVGWIGPEQLGILRPIQGVGNDCVGWVFHFCFSKPLYFSTFFLIVLSIKWEASISIEMLPVLAHPHLFI